jgi:hypothetical protein
LTARTLNDHKSVGKNWQNMINDLATEATTVLQQVPTAAVGFIVAIPSPCLPAGARTNAIVGTLRAWAGGGSLTNPLTAPRP